jgi:hypothetical protein
MYCSVQELFGLRRYCNMDSNTLKNVLMQVVTYLVVSIVLFLKNGYGVLRAPYKTVRRLSKGQKLYQLAALYLLILLYVFWATVVKKGLHLHPFILTLSFTKLLFGIVFTYVAVLFAIWKIPLLFGGRGSIKTIILPWSYSLLPTLLWFFTVSFLWLLVPPPRTISYQGQAFSALFVFFSTALLLWKLVLYYLTLRFGMKLTMFKIICASVILFPIFILYSRLMYALGIFRIPFI